MQQTSIKGVRIGRKCDLFRIVQEIEFWPYYMHKPEFIQEN